MAGIGEDIGVAVDSADNVAEDRITAWPKVASCPLVGSFRPSGSYWVALTSTYLKRTFADEEDPCQGLRHHTIEAPDGAGRSFDGFGDAAGAEQVHCRHGCASEVDIGSGAGVAAWDWGHPWSTFDRAELLASYPSRPYFVCHPCSFQACH